MLEIIPKRNLLPVKKLPLYGAIDLLQVQEIGGP